MQHIVTPPCCSFDKESMPDVQNTRKDHHQVEIKKVGVRNIEIPFQVHQKDWHRKIDVKGTFSAYVHLTAENKGINMSRLPRTIMAEVLEERKDEKESVAKMMARLVKELRDANRSKFSYVKVKFSYPYLTSTYASTLATYEYVDITWETMLPEDSDVPKHLITVDNVGMSLCPCSKEMSLLKNNLSAEELDDLVNLPGRLYDKVMQAGFGAHNQRSHVGVTVEMAESAEEPLWFEDLIDITNKAFSAPIKNILKREDEKIEGEMAYLGGYWGDTDQGKTFFPVEGTGPKFVEDIARDNARQLEELLDKSIRDFVVVVRNSESIHSRDVEAVAVISAGRDLQ